MLPLYLGALALGGVLIAASVLMGGGSDSDVDVDADVDVDVDVDVDADIDVDVDADADLDIDGGMDKDVDVGAWLPFLSVRFWTFGLASFGLMGTLLTLEGFGTAVAAPSSSVLGLVVGWTAAWAFRKLKASSVSGDTGLRDVGGSEGEVLLPVGPGKRGKIRAMVGGQWVDLIAETGDGDLIQRKEKVLVVAVTDGVAQVTRLRQLTGGGN